MKGDFAELMQRAGVPLKDNLKHNCRNGRIVVWRANPRLVQPMTHRNRTSRSEAEVVALPTLLGLMQRAQRAVPAVKYALGVVGIAAAAAATSLLLGHTRTSIISVGLMLAGMVVLFVFAQLVSSGASRSVQAAANVILWTVVLIFAGALICGFLAVVARWPPALVDFLFPKTERSVSELLQQVIARENVISAEAAASEIVRRCEKGCPEREQIRKSI
jgi:hypothetical protein